MRDGQPGEVDERGDAERHVAPRILGADRMRAELRMRLFGDASPPAPASAIATPLDAERARQAAEASDPETLGRIGRFTLRGRLGSGGMGVVYRAYDPELDREVAIKLLRAELGDDDASSNGASRLQREAQAMARLNHPNVVVVHEVGTFDHRIFVAMELVQGVTLRQWLGTPRAKASGLGRTRAWGQVLPPFLQAAAGLAAAHRAGIVHRDFKPDNVMIDEDGRVRVLDFGLARATEIDPITHRTWSDSRDEADSMSGPLRTALTRTGAIMGTPAYMAPEQHLGAPADARSDQFSFCMALYEALYGERPFTGGSYAELAANVTHGRRTPRPHVAVPRAIVRAIDRGLSIDPTRRFATLDDLHRALEAGTRPRRRGGMVVIATGATLAAVMAFTQLRAPHCEDVVHEMDGVWDADRRERLAAAFAQLGETTARPVTASTETLLDGYAARVLAHASELCAARAIGPRDETLLARRERCLSERKAELGGLVELLIAGDRKTLFEAVDAAATLSDVEACSDPRRLVAWTEPRTPEALRLLAQAHVDLARARVLGLLGRYDEAVRTAERIARVARDQRDAASEAAAWLVVGQFQERQGHPRAAEATLRQAIARADEARAHELRVLALMRLVYVVGLDPRRFGEVETLAAEARAVLHVLGSDALLQAMLDANLGGAAWRAERFPVALEHFTRALALAEERYGSEHPYTARARSNRGLALSVLERHDEAQAHYQQALASLEAALGPEHPFVAIVLGSIASDWTRQGRHDRAAALQARAVAIHEASFGPGHAQGLRSRFNLAHSLYEAGRYTEAEQQLATAEPWLERAELTSRVRAEWKLLAAFVAVHRGRYDDATRGIEAATAIAPETLGHDTYFYRMLLTARTDWHEARRLAQQEIDRFTVKDSRTARDEDALARLRGFLALAEHVLVLEP